MLIDLIILIVCCVTIALLALIILARNPKQADNIRFALMTVPLILWSVSNYYSDHAKNHILLYTQFTFFFGIISLFALMSFVTNFPKRLASVHIRRILLQLYAILTLVLIITVFTPAFISSINIEGSNASINTGYLYNLFLLFVFYSLILLIVILYKQYKSTIYSKEKLQIAIMSWAIFLYAIFAVISNVLLPLIVNNWSSSRYGPTFTLVFVLILTYAIIKHRLFDIRLVVARSAAYILTLGVVALILIVPTVLIANLFLNNSLKARTLTLLVIVAFFGAILFQPLRNLFNKLTNKYFYRDFYDIRDILDNLGDVLVRSVSAQEIQKLSKNIISSALKPLGIDFLLLQNYSDLGTDKKELLTHLKSYNHNILVTDDLEKDTGSVLKVSMSKNNYAVAVRLRTKDLTLGYIVVGYKRSGSIYYDTDKRLLTIAADEIAISLQNALRFEEIQQFNVTLQDKVDEATLKLRRANDKLRALDETKDDFISMASHQLRTPLTSVKGYISMVLEGDVGKISKTQKDMLNQAFFSSQRMVYLIADLLNVSRLKTGKFIIELSPVNLAEIISQELSQLGETVKSKSLELTYDKPKIFPTLMLDETKTRQVIMNFIDNAIYYTPSGGKIHVRLVDNQGSVELRVEDNGIGVPKADQHHLFNKFYRAGNARKARPDGTGLGLFMAKKVVLAEGGSIIFESAEGKGSTFGFNFPKAKLTPKDGGKMPVKEEPAKDRELAVTP